MLKSNTDRSSTSASPPQPANELSPSKDTGRIQPSLNNHNTARNALPSLQDILPLVDDYFSNFNKLIPLFRETTFRESLSLWDKDRSGSDALIEASINIVLALSLQYRATTWTLPGIKSVDQLVNNAQLPIGVLVSRVQDLRGLQILLGLSLLFQRTPDPQPALIFIATAVQLAHRLRVHEDPSQWNLPPDMAAERNCLFWITYILDKDINIRSSVPYIHQDHDTSVEPPSTFDNGNIDAVGIVVDRDHRPIFNLMVARFHLARILGRVYDWTHSAVHRGRPRLDRQPQVDRLRQILRNWEEAMPEEFFETDDLLKRLPECSRRQVLILRFDYVYVLFKTYGVFIHDAEWISLLARRSDQHGDNYYETGDRLMTENWPELVSEARKAMALYRYVDWADNSLIWFVSLGINPYGMNSQGTNTALQEHLLHIHVRHDHVDSQ